MDLENVSDLQSFKTEILRATTQVPIEEIDRAINCFTRRVRKVEEMHGGYPYK